MRTLLGVVLAGSAACTTAPPPSDPDNLLAGTYRVTLTAKSLEHRSQVLSGTLILADQPSPRGCFYLTGDLRVIAIDAATDTGSFARNTRWVRSPDGRLKLPLYRGVDYGYTLTLVIRNGSLVGDGSYYAPSGGITSSDESSVQGVRVGPPELLRCYALR